VKQLVKRMLIVTLAIPLLVLSIPLVFVLCLLLVLYATCIAYRDALSKYMPLEQSDEYEYEQANTW